MSEMDCNKELTTFRIIRLFVESLTLLMLFELIMAFRHSQALYDIVRAQEIRATTETKGISIYKLCHVMDLACVFYFKKVYCLQRSAATTVLLRRHGWDATMVTGAQILPPEFHAWVQVDDVIVNDKPYMSEIYQAFECY